MAKLYLIRHGQAVVNVEPIIGGIKGDRGLTDLGVQQAEHLRDRLIATREIVPDLFICSTMPRAMQTAEIIAPAFAQPLIYDETFCEFNVGEADGLSWKEYNQRYGKFDFDLRKPLSPGGETWQSFCLRTHTNFERVLKANPDATIVIVCHGWVIESSLSYFWPHTRSEQPNVDLEVTNTSLTHWYQHQRGGQVRWFLGGYNDAVHLHAAVRWQLEGDLEGEDHPAAPLGEL
ncbi:histidine phosphatase family protein [Herpetosiphon geysericola]|uniref:Phosphoglycerate mutase n=1 Tax=Herpetosiphon geysericola TaxID=70996 RepID=A0A0N8GP98_9CHLR|nr:histidine phosphatase family protein [Herpetosiphon geysericola]KPL80298.1 hypothetical protein SE18_24950 [Herpetosiphon geysericola]